MVTWPNIKKQNWREKNQLIQITSNFNMKIYGYYKWENTNLHVLHFVSLIFCEEALKLWVYTYYFCHNHLRVRCKNRSANSIILQLLIIWVFGCARGKTMYFRCQACARPRFPVGYFERWNAPHCWKKKLKSVIVFKVWCWKFIRLEF